MSQMNGELSFCLHQTSVYPIPTRLASIKFFFVILTVLFVCHGYLIRISFTFVAFLKLVLSISFLSSLPPYFLNKKHLQSSRFKEFLRLLFTQHILIDKCLNHFRFSSQFFSNYPYNQFPFFSLPANFFQNSLSFYYILGQVNRFNLRFFFPSLSILIIHPICNLPFYLLSNNVRIANRLHFFIPNISHKPF